MLLASNLRSLRAGLDRLEAEAVRALEEQRADIQHETDAAAGLLLAAEHVAAVDAALVALLCGAARRGGPTLSQVRGAKSPQAATLDGLLFQPVISSSADFQLVAHDLGASGPASAAVGTKRSGKQSSPPPSNSAVELVRLYKTSLGAKSVAAPGRRTSRLFAVLTLEKLRTVAAHGWAHLVDAALFSTDAGAHRAICELYTGFHVFPSALLSALHCAVEECEDPARLAGRYRAALAVADPAESGPARGKSAVSSPPDRRAQRPSQLQRALDGRLLVLVGYAAALFAAAATATSDAVVQLLRLRGRAGGARWVRRGGPR